MFWMDSTDTVGAFNGALLKDSSNLPSGVSTYGPCEYISYMDDLIFNSWITCSQYGGMGMCGGLILTAFATRAIFLPIGFYGQIIGYKMKLLAPDMEEFQANMKRYQKQGNKDAVNIEK